MYAATSRVEQMNAKWLVNRRSERWLPCLLKEWLKNWAPSLPTWHARSLTNTASLTRLPMILASEKSLSRHYNGCFAVETPPWHSVAWKNTKLSPISAGKCFAAENLPTFASKFRGGRRWALIRTASLQCASVNKSTYWLCVCAYPSTCIVCCFRDCQTDPTCCFCMECFEHSEHKNHNYRVWCHYYITYVTNISYCTAICKQVPSCYILQCYTCATVALVTTCTCTYAWKCTYSATNYARILVYIPFLLDWPAVCQWRWGVLWLWWPRGMDLICTLRHSQTHWTEWAGCESIEITFWKYSGYFCGFSCGWIRTPIQLLSHCRNGYTPSSFPSLWQVDPVEALPSDLVDRARPFFLALLWYCMDMLCWETADSLPPALMQTSTARWSVQSTYIHVHYEWHHVIPLHAVWTSQPSCLSSTTMRSILMMR